mgnify:CR=1 FL=1
MIEARRPIKKMRALSKIKVSKRVASGVTMEKISKIKAFLKRFFFGVIISIS